MFDCYQLTQGYVPVLISMPHVGECLPEDIAKTMTTEAQKVADTDWYLDKLYAFAQAQGVYVLQAKYNRYVIDLNRSSEDIILYPGEDNTGLCPVSAFDHSPLYHAENPLTEQEIKRRVSKYWQPYHQALEQSLQDIKAKFGQVVLLDAHSILSRVPRFFDGQLADFNLGTNNGISCAPELLSALAQLNYHPYTMVANGRFKGGYITRCFGQPEQDIHAVQLELSQATYMDEAIGQYDELRAAQVQPKLEALVQCLIDFSLNETVNAVNLSQWRD